MFIANINFYFTVFNIHKTEHELYISYLETSPRQNMDPEGDIQRHDLYYLANTTQ